MDVCLWHMCVTKTLFLCICVCACLDLTHGMFNTRMYTRMDGWVCTSSGNHWLAHSSFCVCPLQNALPRGICSPAFNIRGKPVRTARVPVWAGAVRRRARAVRRLCRRARAAFRPHAAAWQRAYESRRIRGCWAAFCKHLHLDRCNDRYHVCEWMHVFVVTSRLVMVMNARSFKHKHSLADLQVFFTTWFSQKSTKKSFMHNQNVRRLPC